MYAQQSNSRNGIVGIAAFAIRPLVLHGTGHGVYLIPVVYRYYSYDATDTCNPCFASRKWIQQLQTPPQAATIEKILAERDAYRYPCSRYHLAVFPRPSSIPTFG